MITWHEMRHFQQPRNYTVWQWSFYSIVKTWKKWVMTLSSLMAIYSAMRDIPDPRKVPMERWWVALYFHAKCKFWNLLSLEQRTFEYGLPFFWYALYNSSLNLVIRRFVYGLHITPFIRGNMDRVTLLFILSFIYTRQYFFF